MNFLKNLKEKTSIFATKLKEEITKLTIENEEISKKNEEEEKSYILQVIPKKIVKFFKFKGKNQACLPWENLRNQSSKTNGSFSDIIREEILALSKVLCFSE